MRWYIFGYHVFVCGVWSWGKAQRIHETCWAFGPIRAKKYRTRVY